VYRAIIVLLAALAFAVPAHTVSDPGTSSFPSPVPCSDPRGCPDLVTDTAKLVFGTQLVETFGPQSCDVQEGMVREGERSILRFTFSSPNLGAGNLIVGRPADHPEWFVFAPCHNHYHFREYADYRLWTVTGFLAWNDLRNQNPQEEPSQVLAEHPELLSELTAGAKRGFCIIDIAIDVAVPGGVPIVPDLPPRFGNCNNNQGITRGWADEYLFTLSGQYIDVTDTPAGAYVLEAEVNAERLYTESNYANNRAWLPVVVGTAI
jgi:hypothetical protein